MTQHAPEERGMPGLDYPPMPDYPPATDYSSMPERTSRPSYPLLPARREKLLAQQEEVLAQQGGALAQQGEDGPPTDGPPAAEPPRPGDTLTDVFQPAVQPATVPPATQPAAVPSTAVQAAPVSLAAAPPAATPAAGRADDSQAGQPGAARREQGAPGEAEPSRARLAMLAYLTVPVFGPVVPLVARLRAGRSSPWLRGHATQALNVWLTVFIYGISGAIMGAMLALDSPWVAVGVMVPLIVLLWGVTVTRLARAATAASEGRTYTFPRWLCSQILR